MTSSDELNLLLSLLLTAGVLYAALQFSRQFAGASVAKLLTDSALLFSLIVYLSVCVPGALHCLNCGSMFCVAAICSASLFALSFNQRQPLGAPMARDSWIALTAALFAGGYLLAFAYNQRFLPPVATDPLVYQLSMPVFWIRRHAVAIFPTWYWNPANSYAPAAPVSWFVWVLLPLGNDALARFAQVPAILWIFVLVYRGFSGEREIGAGGIGKSAVAIGSRNQHGRDARATKAVIAAAAVLSRPIISEAIFAKDDLIVTALFLATLLAFRRDSLKDRFGPWRVGIALGLTLACKYTVLLVCPLLLFVIDAPFRAGWKRRDFVTAILIAAALAAPWYLRNLLLMGDPLFPADVRLLGIRLFTGLFGTERDQQLRSAGGITQMLSATYHSLPIPLLVALALTWCTACAAAGRSLLRDPMRRAALLGSAATLVLFLIASPHHEVRYLFPLIVLWFDSATLAINRWMPASRGKLAAGIVLAGVSTATSFDLNVVHRILPLAISAGVFAAVGVGSAMLLARQPRLRIPALATALLATSAGIYIFWHAYLGQYANVCTYIWTEAYPTDATAWAFIRDQTRISADANIAFANTQFTYPLYGFNYRRDVAYAPTRRGLHAFRDFPRMGETVPGDLIVQTMTRAMTADPDKQTWLDNLHAQRANYVVIFRHEMVEHPVEIDFAESEPSKFLRVYGDDDAVIYEIAAW